MVAFVIIKIWISLVFNKWLRNCVSRQAHDYPDRWFSLGMLAAFFLKRSFLPEMEHSFHRRHYVKVQAGFTNWEEICLALV